jgi:hypothetical protein
LHHGNKVVGFALAYQISCGLMSDNLNRRDREQNLPIDHLAQAGCCATDTNIGDLSESVPLNVAELPVPGDFVDTTSGHAAPEETILSA